MDFIDRYFYQLLVLWILLSLAAAYNSSFRAALPVKIEEAQDQLVLLDNDFISRHQLTGFPGIESFNGTSISDLREIESAIEGMQIGEEVAFSFSNGLSASYRLVRNYPSSFIALNIVVALLFYGIAALVWKMDSRRENKYFPLTGFLFGYAVMCRWTGLYVPFMSDIVVAIFFFSYPFAYSFLLIFGYQFPSTTHTPRSRTITKRVILSCACFFTVTLMTLFFWKSISGSPESIAAYDDFYRIFRAYGIVCMILTLLLMVNNERRESNPVSRQRLLWIIGGLVFGTFPFFILWNLPQVFELPGILPEWFPIPFLILAPASFAVAIVKYRLFDIELMLSRSLTYGIVLALLIAIYVVMTGGLSILLYDTLSLDSPHLSMLSTISVALIFTPVRRSVQMQVDKRFFRIRYDRFRCVQNFMQDLESCHDQTQVFTLLEQHFQNSVPVEKQVFIKYEVQNWMALQADGENHEVPMEWTLDIKDTHDIVLSRHHLQRFEDTLAWETADLPSAWLVCIPLGAHTKWLFGDKKSGSRFWQEDLTLAVQMARAAGLQQEKLHYIQRALQEELDRKQAERMNDWKTMLVAEVAHDLRAPLNTLLWKLRTFKDRQLTQEESDEKYEDVKRHIYRLQSFVQNLLVLSNIGSQSGFTLHPFQILEQIDAVLAGLQSLLSDRELSTLVECDPGISILGEPIVFQEILLNVVQNAAKFSTPGESISISVEECLLDGRPMVLTMIKDQAGGIPKEVLKSLSVPIFFRANKKQLREAFDKEDPKGFHLGLYISHEFTKLMNGKMEIEGWARGTIVKLWFERNQVLADEKQNLSTR